MKESGICVIDAERRETKGSWMKWKRESRGGNK